MIKIPSKTLLNSLKKLKPIIDQKTTLSVLDNFKIEGNTISASSNEIAIIDTLPDFDNTERRLLPFKFLFDICILTAGDLSIEGTTVKTPGGPKRFGEQADLAHYPIIEPLKGYTSFEVKANFIKALIKAAKFVSTNELEMSRMANVNVKKTGDTIVVQATDVKVFYHETFEDNSEVDFNILIPLNTIKCLPESDSTITISDNKISFRQKNTEIIGTLIDGKFPNTDHIFNNNYPEKIDFNIYDFSDKLKAMNICPDADFCTMYFNGDTIKFYAVETTTENDSVEILQQPNKISIKDVCIKHRDVLKLIEAFSDNNDRLVFSFAGNMIMIKSGDSNIIGVIVTLEKPELPLPKTPELKQEMPFVD